jgi:hypothetical protein
MARRRGEAKPYRGRLLLGMVVMAWWASSGSAASGEDEVWFNSPMDIQKISKEVLKVCKAAYTWALPAIKVDSDLGVQAWGQEAREAGNPHNLSDSCLNGQCQYRDSLQPIALA